MGYWRFWVCIPCYEYLDQIERQNYDIDEGEK
jgi:hypothetical protein